MSSIHDKIEASARAVLDLEQSNAESKNDLFFIYWLRSRQDKIDIASTELLDNNTVNPSVLKNQLITLFDKYVSDSTFLTRYCKNKVGESREHAKNISDLQGQVQSLKDDKASLIDSLDWHREDLRVSRLDAADLQEAAQHEHNRFMAMKSYYERQQKFQDLAHEKALTKLEARHEALLNDHANLQVQHEAVQADLEASQEARNEDKAHATGLENALKAAYNANDRLIDLVHSLHETDVKITGDFLTEGGDDEIKDEDDGVKSEDGIKDEEGVKAEDDESAAPMFTSQQLSSPPHAMYGLEWH